MVTLLEHLGGLLDRWRGRSKTLPEQHLYKHSTQFVRLEHADGFYITITSHRRVFRTTYRRWWIPSRLRAVFEVVGSVPDNTPEDVMARLDPRLFTPVTYPCLSTRLLQWSHFPHVYAIKAFLEQVPQYCGDSPASLLA